MRTQAHAAASIWTCGAAVTQAEPCVSDTFDRPLDGATNVVTRRADVPSPRFPGLWQEGNLNGLFYAIYANGDGMVKTSHSARDWSIKVNCQQAAQDCVVTIDGTPSQGAQEVAAALLQCLKGERPAARETEVEQLDPAPPLPCGIAAMPDAAPVAMLQNLLVAAGADPGPVDGFMGTKTRVALTEALGSTAPALSTDAAIAALDTLLCAAP